MPASSEAGRALEALREKERQRADRSAARPREAVGAQSPTRVIRGTVSKAPATPPARAGKGVQMKRLVQEVELESMKGLMEGVGAELLSAEKWSWLKKQARVGTARLLTLAFHPKGRPGRDVWRGPGSQIYLEECWRPQVSLLVSVGFKAPDLERLVDARSDILDFKPQVRVVRGPRCGPATVWCLRGWLRGRPRVTAGRGLVGSCPNLVGFFGRRA